MLAIVRIALSRPYTFIVAALLIFLLGTLAALGCEVDAWETTYYQILPGNDSQHTRELLSLLCVHALEAGMRIGTAHHVSIDHFWQLNIVHIVALALEKAQIFFALDGVAHATNLRRCLEDHLFLPGPSCRRRTARL